MNKKLITALLIATTGASATFAQEYTLTGTAPEGITEVVLHHYSAPRQKPDTVAVNAGTFVISGKADGNIFGELEVNKKFYPVILEGTLTFDVDNKITGTREQQCLHQWLTRIKPTAEKAASIMNEYNELRQSGKPISDSLHTHYSERYMACVNEVLGILKPCFPEYTDMKFPAYFLYQFSAYMDREELLALADEEPVYLEQPLMAALNQRIDGWRKQAVGIPFTDLSMADTTGTMRRLSEFVGKGNYVLIDFWASWCGPCRRDMPHVKALYEKYHPKGFDIVGISFDNNHKAWVSAIRKMQLPWHHISDLKGWESLGASTYGIYSIPATLLIAPDGKIAASGLRGEALDKKLAEIYGE